MLVIAIYYKYNAQSVLCHVYECCPTAWFVTNGSDFTNEISRYEGRTTEMSSEFLVMISLYIVTFEFSPQDLKTNPVKSSGHFMHHLLLHQLVLSFTYAVYLFPC